MDQAIADYNRAIDLSPKWFAPYLNKAIILDDQGRKKEALQAYRKFIEVAPPQLGTTTDRVKARVKQLEKAN